MALYLRRLARCLAVVLGTLGVSFAVNRWLWFRTLPRLADAQLCGNCFLASVGVPIEMGLLGLLLAAGSQLGIPCRGRDLAYWSGTAIGVYFTPLVLGAPVFAFSFLALLCHAGKSLLTGPASRGFRA
jgi:hypothetical protein